MMACAAHAAPNMTGRASVNITSDTAATAKIMAMAEARRQIVRDVLGQYSDKSQLDLLLRDAPDNDLTYLITSSSIDNEQQSATTYSANITMTLERVAAQNWLNDNGIPNWLGDSTSADKVLVFADLANGLGDWMNLQAAARANGIELNTRRIAGPQVVVEIPSSSRAAFTASVAGAGWRYADMDGTLRIWRQ